MTGASVLRGLRRRALALAGAAACTLVPRTALADDCSGLVDCYDQILTWALIIAGIILLALIAWELIAGTMFVEGAALALEEGALLAEGAEVAGAAELAEGEALLDIAEGTEIIEDAALEEAEVTQVRFPGLRDVNPGRFRTNCGWCSEIGDGVLKGEGAIAAPDGGLVNTARLAEDFGSVWENSSLYRVEELIGSQPNSQGILFIQRGTLQGEGVGHFLNVVNRGGNVWYVDFQTGAELASREALLDYMGLTDATGWIRFLPTT